jgi:hypothetical protein
MAQESPNVQPGMRNAVGQGVLVVGQVGGTQLAPERLLLAADGDGGDGTRVQGLGSRRISHIVTLQRV